VERVFLTGITGATGVPLANALHSKGHVVSGCSRRGRTHNCGLHEHIRVFKADLTDPVACFWAVNGIEPTVVVHLAGATNVRDAVASPHATLALNVGALFNLTNFLSHVWPIRYIVASSSEVYGDTLGVLTDLTPPAPKSVYGVSKMAQEHVLEEQVNVRTFWNINPLRADSAISQFARKIAEVEAGMRDDVDHGDLESLRSFMDYTDVVRAYLVLIESGVTEGTYNVGSDLATDVHRIGDYLDILRDMAACDIPTRTNIRDTGERDVVHPGLPDINPMKALRWAPTSRLEESLAHALHHARGLVA
jgi:nucleoside-diphosphate-sugar epimerase